jgi:hypothetical protein
LNAMPPFIAMVWPVMSIAPSFDLTASTSL